MIVQVDANDKDVFGLLVAHGASQDPRTLAIPLIVRGNPFGNKAQIDDLLATTKKGSQYCSSSEGTFWVLLSNFLEVVS